MYVYTYTALYAVKCFNGNARPSRILFPITCSVYNINNITVNVYLYVYSGDFRICSGTEGENLVFQNPMCQIRSTVLLKSSGGKREKINRVRVRWWLAREEIGFTIDYRTDADFSSSFPFFASCTPTSF